MGMNKNCNKFHLIKSTTTCQGVLTKYGIDLATFTRWNPSVKSDCTNLQIDTYVCVGIIGSTAPTTTTKPPSNGIATPTPTQSGMVRNCNKFHLIKTDSTCQGLLDKYDLTLATLFKWNPAVGKDCTNLWVNTYACVGVISPSSTTKKTTTKKPSTTKKTTKPTKTGVTTPTPTQSGMTKGCTKFHHVVSKNTCQGILDKYKITLEKFYKWNPAVKKDCTNLWANTYACVKGP